MLTKSFPHTEVYGLTSQLNRASISVPSNIAEGSSRESNKEFSYYISVALGSCFEIETQLHLANALNYITIEQFQQLETRINELERMLQGFKKTLAPPI